MQPERVVYVGAVNGCKYQNFTDTKPPQLHMRAWGNIYNTTELVKVGSIKPGG